MGNTVAFEEGHENVSLAEENKNLENLLLVEEENNNDIIESLSKFKKRISTAIRFDNDFESAMKQVKDAQSNRILNYYRTKPIRNKESFDILLEEIGVMMDIDALEVGANRKFINKLRLRQESFSHIVTLIREKADLKKTIDDLQKKIQDYQALESSLAFQKEATQKCFGELEKLSQLSGPIHKSDIDESFLVCDSFLRNQK